MKKAIRTILSLCLILAMILPAGTAYAASQGPDRREAAACFQQTLAHHVRPGIRSLSELIAQLRALCTGDGTGSTLPDNDPSTDSDTPSDNDSNTDSDNGAAGEAVPGQILRLVNEERAEAGLASLTLSDELSRAARAKAEDMAKNGYFSHTSPTYGSPFDQMHSFGITFSAAAENIAKGYPDADSVMTGWMNSEGHRANILNSSFTHLGVGYAVDEHGTAYWVQMFLKP